MHYKLRQNWAWGLWSCCVCHHTEVTTVFIPAMHMDSLIFIQMYSTPLNKEEVLLGCCFLNTKRECIISVKMAISAFAALNKFFFEIYDVATLQ